MKMYEGTRNDTSPKIIDGITLGPNSNLQVGIRCFSLATDRMLKTSGRKISYKLNVKTAESYS